MTTWSWVPDAVDQLVAGLQQRPEFGALAADCAGEMDRGWEHWDYPSHVGMAAVMFRRERLAELTFRWEAGKCECRCCCEDLRTRGHAIGYLAGAQAWHRPSPEVPRIARHTTAAPADRPRSGRILAAFDRRDHERFRTQFLPTLRASGNDEPVWAFAYGLFPTEIARLATYPGVHVVAIPDNGTSPALRRLHDFQAGLADLSADAPVAYWDAGDVLFQDRLQPLWDMIQAEPDLLLVVEESQSYPDNPVIRTWSDKIRDSAARARAFEIMSTHVFLNSGFAGGTARSLGDYLREGDRLLNSPALEGVGSWGDQPALNLYCHTRPGCWRAIPPGWNYTMAGRDPGEHRIATDGRTQRFDGKPIQVLHGNAGTLRWLHLSPRPLASWQSLRPDSSTTETADPRSSIPGPYADLGLSPGQHPRACLRAIERQPEAGRGSG